MTPNCTATKGQPCCYFQSIHEIAGRGTTPLFDCWDKTGLPPSSPPKPPPGPAPRPWAGPHSCCCVSCQLPPECNGMAGAGVTSTCPSMMWRDPSVASRFFNDSRSFGTGSQRRWVLNFVATDQTSRYRIEYRAVVAGNGTIVSLHNATSGEAMELRQYRYDGLIEGLE